jgi:DNA ligase D-like protein (predicted polymerase)
MLIRRNTKEFKGIRNLLSKYAGQPARKKLIRLYVVKAGETLKDKIAIDRLGSEADFYYDLNYSSILSHLDDPDYRLHKSSSPGLYYFKSIHFPKWEQTPFMVPQKLLGKIEVFAGMPSPPRARQKPGRAIEELPEDAPAFEGSRAAGGKEKNQRQKARPARRGSSRRVEKEEAPHEAVYGSKHRIVFQGIDEVIFDKGGITLGQVLEYYDEMAEYILPYIRDRAQSFYLDGKKETIVRGIQHLHKQVNVKLPSWIKQVKKHSKKDDHDKHYFVCRDKDHLFYLLKMGAYELHPWLTKVNDPEHPDHFVINLRPAGASFKHTIAVARAAQDVLRNSFKSHIKLSEHGGFHIYVPWEEKVSIAMTRKIAGLVAEQVHARTNKISSLKQNETGKKGKVYIDVSENADPPRTLIAPYSLILESDNARVAAPLSWEEVKEGLDPDDFTIHTVMERVRKMGDVWDR